MKKLISLLGIIVLLFDFCMGASKVRVGASVGYTNKPPVITSINPDSSLHPIMRGTTMTFSFDIEDPEGDNIVYTVSAGDDDDTALGAVNPISGVIVGSGSVSVLYLAPSVPVGYSKITISLSDTVNFVTQDVDLYVY